MGTLWKEFIKVRKRKRGRVRTISGKRAETKGAALLRLPSKGSFIDGWRMLPPSGNYWHMWRMRADQVQGANLLLPCSVVSGCKISLI